MTAATTQLFDSHCHFDFAEFDVDRAAVWRHAESLGVKNAFIPGVAPEQWSQAQKVSEELSGLYHGVAIHPWWLKDVWPEQRQAREALAELVKSMTHSPRCIALGECGLDGAIDTPMEQQLEAVTWHLELAQETGYPIIFHCHKAHHLLHPLLKKFALPQGGIIHAFSGSQRNAEDYWELGYYLGIGGTITYERAHKTREAIKHMPLEALVLETDAPDMPMHGRQGQRNSPEYLPQILEALAELHQQPESLVAQQTTVNAQHVFRLTAAS